MSTKYQPTLGTKKKLILCLCYAISWYLNIHGFLESLYLLNSISNQNKTSKTNSVFIRIIFENEKIWPISFIHTPWFFCLQQKCIQFNVVDKYMFCVAQNCKVFDIFFGTIIHIQNFVLGKERGGGSIFHVFPSFFKKNAHNLLPNPHFYVCCVCAQHK
jgi:hypothetical protein